VNRSWKSVSTTKNHLTRSFSERKALAFLDGQRRPPSRTASLQSNQSYSQMSKPLAKPIRYPATKAIATAKRKQSLSHPWNRGYPNNGKLRKMAA